MTLKGYTIGLETNELSIQLSSECIDSGKKFGVDIERFGGVNGNYADPILKSLGLFPYKAKSKASRPGVKGCFLSHFFLWQRCVELDQPIVIFEHDGLLIRPMPDDILDHFTDVLKLDSCDQYSKYYESCLNQEGPIVYSEYYNPKAKPDTLCGEYLRGAYAYIIKPKAAQTIIDHCLKFGFLPADHQIGKKIVDIRTCFPSIARLHPYYSIDDNIKSKSLTKYLPPV